MISRNESRSKNIQFLMDYVKNQYESKDNQLRQNNWVSFAGLPGIFVRHLPKKDLNNVPFIADLDREMWASIFQMDLNEVYTDPDAYLEFELRKKVYAYQNFFDDNPLTDAITMWFGVGYWESLLGIPQEPAQSGHEPWVGKISIIKEKADLDKVPIPDFYNFAPAKLAHIFYARIKEQVGDDFKVIFPEWDFGPFGIATHLRGMENLSIDFIDDPVFVHELMKFLLRVKKSWSLERAKFLGVAPQPLYIANDDINVPIISPKAYREFILPYEKEISLFHGGIDYWHSCGRIDPVLKDIMEIPSLKMVHISPWTDIEKAASVANREIILEIVLNPVDDVEKATPQEMKEKLRRIKDCCQGLHYTVRADAFQICSTLENDLIQIKQWIEIAREELSCR
ncbi:MAG TPA: hypothetical protein DCY12_00370 [Candidatus Atribacteria bacterium]|nr:hypothetical protein [Candidatus Atribacteria bacterium]